MKNCQWINNDHSNKEFFKYPRLKDRLVLIKDPLKMNHFFYKELSSNSMSKTIQIRQNYNIRWYVRPYTGKRSTDIHRSSRIKYGTTLCYCPLNSVQAKALCYDPISGGSLIPLDEYITLNEAKQKCLDLNATLCELTYPVLRSRNRTILSKTDRS